MPAGLWRCAVNGPRDRRTHASDEGFTLIEVLVSITLMSIVMAALSAFFLTTVSATNQQSARQSATQLAQDAIELARALKGSAILTGRQAGQCPAGNALCDAPVAGVAPYLADLEEWDNPTGTAAAQLPLKSKTVAVNGVTYTQNWSVGRCWQPVPGGTCQKDPGAGLIQFLRVVVGVAWSERHCPANACSFMTSTLVSGASASPLFNSNQMAQPPAVNNPGNQVDDLNLPVNLTLTATGGAPPVSWTATGLPPGLSLSPTGVVSGAPTSNTTYSVTVTATDGFKLSASAAFTWTIKPLPTVSTPGAQNGEATVAATAVQVTATNGVAPYTWSATGLPPGLSIDGTGKITGTPTTAGAYSAVATATDAKGKTASSNAFAWNVIAAPTITAPTGTRTDQSTKAVTVTSTVSGGTAPYSWTAANLPAGLSISSSTGVISGTLGLGTRYLTTITVTDAKGATNSVVIDWNVTAQGNGLRVTSPTADRTDIHGNAVSFTATASHGNAGYTWSATGLPTGIGITSGGVVSGTPTVAGTYTVKLTVRDANFNTATFMFTWTVQ